ncbi:MAG: hypothetical protein ABIR94_21405, partial [Rubrivivax sp.]
MRFVVHPAAQLELDAALARSRMEFGPGMVARLLRRCGRSGQVLLRHPSLALAESVQSRASWQFELSLTPESRAGFLVRILGQASQHH